MQKRAYYSGMGYRCGYYGKEIPFSNEKNKSSFQAGYSAAGAKMSKYKDLKKR